MGRSNLNRYALLLFLSITLFPSHSYAEEYSYSVDYIRGEGDADGIKLAVQYHTNYLKDWSEHLHLYFESSINFWEYGDGNQTDTNFVLSLSPVILYPIGRIRSNPVFVEFGIGVALLSETTFAGKDVSTHYQFEDRLGLVTKFGEDYKNQIALRYFHYSNAGFKKPNPGLDFVSLSYMRRF